MQNHVKRFHGYPLFLSYTYLQVQLGDAGYGFENDLPLTLSNQNLMYNLTVASTTNPQNLPSGLRNFPYLNHSAYKEKHIGSIKD